MACLPSEATWGEAHTRWEGGRVRAPPTVRFARWGATHQRWHRILRAPGPREWAGCPCSAKRVVHGAATVAVSSVRECQAAKAEASTGRQLTMKRAKRMVQGATTVAASSVRGK